jgi:hypothetical protein
MPDRGRLEMRGVLAAGGGAFVPTAAPCSANAAETGDVTVANDWIRMRTSIDRDPKVQEMARVLAGNAAFCGWLGDPVRQTVTHAYHHVSPVIVRDIVVTALLRVWGAVREQAERVGDHAVMVPCSSFAIDEIAGVPGMAEAMVYVDWLAMEEDTSGRPRAVFLNYLENQKLADESQEEIRRARSRESSRRYRDRRRGSGPEAGGQAVTDEADVTVTRDGHRDITRDAKVTPREEKSQRRIDSDSDSKGAGEGLGSDSGASLVKEPPPIPPGPAPPAGAVRHRRIALVRLLEALRVPHPDRVDAGRLKQVRADYTTVRVIAERVIDAAADADAAGQADELLRLARAPDINHARKPVGAFVARCKERWSARLEGAFRKNGGGR